MKYIYEHRFANDVAELTEAQRKLAEQLLAVFPQMLPQIIVDETLRGHSITFLHSKY